MSSGLPKTKSLHYTPLTLNPLAEVKIRQGAGIMRLGDSEVFVCLIRCLASL